MEDWARGIFGGEYAREIAGIVTEYSRLNLERKPEVNRTGIYSVATGEADRMLRRWYLKPLPKRATDIYLPGNGQRMRSEVFDNIRWLSIDLDIPAPGRHTVKIVMVDPEIVVEKLIFNPDNDNPSYYGL